MKVALIGATGFVGSAVLKELLQRGHEVVALVRDPAKLAAQPRLQAVQADVLDAAAVQRAVAGAGAVVSAYNARSEEHTTELPPPCNLVCRLLLEKKKTKLHMSSSYRTL